MLELAKKNAHVIVASRTPSKAQVVVDEVKAVTQNDKVEFLQLDLLSLKSVTEFLTAFKAKGLPLHLLLNNAGVMACPYALSEDGIESQFATNHVSLALSTSPRCTVEPKQINYYRSWHISISRLNCCLFWRKTNQVELSTYRR